VRVMGPHAGGSKGERSEVTVIECCRPDKKKGGAGYLSKKKTRVVGKTQNKVPRAGGHSPKKPESRRGRRRLLRGGNRRKIRAARNEFLTPKERGRERSN